MVVQEVASSIFTTLQAKDAATLHGRFRGYPRGDNHVMDLLLPTAVEQMRSQVSG